MPASPPTKQEAVISALRDSAEPLTPSQIAERVGSTPGSIKQLLMRMKSAGLVTKQGRGAYVLPGQNDGGRGAAPEVKGSTVEKPRAVGSAEEMVRVPLASVRASAGEGEEPFSEEIETYVAYSPQQLRRSGIDPSRVIAVPVSGNSMQPTLGPGDTALVEIYHGEPVRDGVIYVFRHHLNGVVIKRTFWTQEGNLELRSDNPEGPTLTIRPGDEQSWKVIGRVVRVEKAL